MPRRPAPKTAAPAPQSAEAFLKGCVALIQGGQHERATARLQKRLKIEPASPMLHRTLAAAHLMKGDGKRSVAAVRAGLKACGAHPLLQNYLVTAQFYAGDREACRKAFESLPFDRVETSALQVYFEAVGFDVSEALLERTVAVLDRGALPPAEAQQLMAAVAQAFETRGDPDQAFAFIRRLNQLYPPAPPGRFAESAAQFEGAFNAAPLDIAEERPRRAPVVFIVGLPRSGSTLLAQCLSGHGDCVAIGEHNGLNTALLATIEALRGEGAAVRSYGEANQRMAPAHLAAMRRLYFKSVEATGVKLGKKWSVDKDLSNYRRLSFLLRAFPDSKVVHAFRHPLDCLLSIMRLSLDAGHAYKRDDASLAAHFQDYVALMDFWGARFPGRIIPVCHERFVEDFEAQIRLLVERLGLPWDARCLAPERSRQAAVTSSAVQVREAVNAEGVGRWRRYERHLQPLIEALGGLETIEDAYGSLRERAC